MAQRGRSSVWNPRRGTHLGQRSCVNAPKGRTYERKRSDQIIKEFSCKEGAVHIWHLDEVVITINGCKHWLWRAVDQDGFVLEVLVQKRRDTKAAKRFIRKLLKANGFAPRVMVTDKLKSYAAANRQIGLTVCDHRQHKGLNNRAENSHQPTRRRERIMKRFKSARHLNGLCPFMIQLPTFTTFPATNSLHQLTANFVRLPCTHGAKSHASKTLNREIKDRNGSQRKLR